MTLTQIEGVPSRDAAKPGMAHFSGSGPGSTTCGGCRYLALQPTRGKASLYRCNKYTQLTGKVGNCIKREFYSCKYFEPRT